MQFWAGVEALVAILAPVSPTHKWCSRSGALRKQAFDPKVIKEELEQSPESLVLFLSSKTWENEAANDGMPTPDQKRSETSVVVMPGRMPAGSFGIHLRRISHVYLQLPVFVRTLVRVSTPG